MSQFKIYGLHCILGRSSAINRVIIPSIFFSSKCLIEPSHTLNGFLLNPMGRWALIFGAPRLCCLVSYELGQRNVILLGLCLPNWARIRIAIVIITIIMIRVVMTTFIQITHSFFFPSYLIWASWWPKIWLYIDFGDDLHKIMVLYLTYRNQFQ